ncbi:hypothetical protein ACFSDD_22530 [Salipiger marinus]|uniref:hypothetical protein n=1 Tax=Salipiger marinus TaxID=555512 RepID=UPI002CBD0AF6|nr:hypothetical protein [Salipiger manganoxidans]MEB3419062.1 hypothetical protein [Salipiger manganoxidans]
MCDGQTTRSASCHSARIWLSCPSAIGIETSEANLTLYGNAVAAAVGLGRWPGLAEAAAALAPPVREIRPDPARSAQYRRLLVQYRQAVDVLAPILHDLADGILAEPPA